MIVLKSPLLHASPVCVYVWPVTPKTAKKMLRVEAPNVVGFHSFGFLFENSFRIFLIRDATKRSGDCADSFQETVTRAQGRRFGGVCRVSFLCALNVRGSFFRNWSRSPQSYVSLTMTSRVSPCPPKSFLTA